MRKFLLAWQFLTIVPLPFALRYREGDLGRAMSFFPLVGLALGGLLAGADFLMAPHLPKAVADLILIALLAGVTGGLHLDGVADVCDGLGARGSRERFLEVMKDPRVGALGAVGLLLTLGLKYQALCALPASHKREVLFFFPLAARCSQVQLAVGAKRAKADGLGASIVAGAGAPQLALSCGMTLAVSYLLLGWSGILCLLFLSLFTFAARTWSHARLGGVTGDVIGCVSELNEILALLFLLALWGNG